MDGGELMKILEVCPYTTAACGVWIRAKQESIEFSRRGHEVMIMSSNFEKGTDKIVPAEESIGNIKIKRFPAKKLGGESFMYWLGKKAMKEAIEFKPDVIIAHGYRHLHTTQALKIGRKLKCPVLLCTHAPFVEGNITRTKLQTLIVKFYDKFIGPRTLNKFDKILAISHWEVPYLIKAGASEDKIIYSPNGIPDEFFNLPVEVPEENKILFLGRIAPKKKIETLIRAIPFIKMKGLTIEVVGPQEEDYMAELEQEIGFERIKFLPPIYDLKEKIKKIDSCKIFVLPSRVEGMPQSLIEAGIRGKTIIASNSIAIRDLISDSKNGYLFIFEDAQSLAEKINQGLEHPINTSNSFKKFNWSLLITNLEVLIKNAL